VDLPAQSQCAWQQRRPNVANSRVLRQVPAITELAQLDSSGKEQLRQSKLASPVERAGLSTLNEGQQVEFEVRNCGKSSAENLKAK
jgi:hypothetical protein